MRVLIKVTQKDEIEEGEHGLFVTKGEIYILTFLNCSSLSDGTKCHQGQWVRCSWLQDRIFTYIGDIVKYRILVIFSMIVRIYTNIGYLANDGSKKLT